MLTTLWLPQLVSTHKTAPRRLVFQGGGMDKAPPSPEQFQSPEKQSMEDRLNEVSSQSPSQIFNDTISAGSAIKTRYTQNTTILAGLANDDPLKSGGSSGSTTVTAGGTAAAGGQTATSGSAATENEKQQ
jgi:hypothetical protein